MRRLLLLCIAHAASATLSCSDAVEFVMPSLRPDSPLLDDTVTYGGFPPIDVRASMWPDTEGMALIAKSSLAHDDFPGTTIV